MPDAPNHTSIDQRRAAYAWKRVQEHRDQKILSPYTNLAKSAPALVMANGLMQTLAFFASKGNSPSSPPNEKSTTKGEEHHKALNADIMRWLTGGGGVLSGCRGDFGAVMDRLLKADSHDYLRATEETFALLRWIRQFAAALDKGR